MEVRGVEGGENAQQVAHVVEAYAVNVRQVVTVFAALHVQAALVFAARLHAGQHLGVAYGVGAAQHLRHGFERSQIPLHRTALRHRHAGTAPPCHYLGSSAYKAVAPWAAIMHNLPPRCVLGRKAQGQSTEEAEQKGETADCAHHVTLQGGLTSQFPRSPDQHIFQPMP